MHIKYKVLTRNGQGAVCCQVHSTLMAYLSSTGAPFCDCCLETRPKTSLPVKVFRDLRPFINGRRGKWQQVCSAITVLPNTDMMYRSCSREAQSTDALPELLRLACLAGL